MPRKPVAPERRCLKFSDWPEQDQTRWLRGISPGISFNDAGPGAHLMPATVEKNEEGYGRWLGFLDWAEVLDGTVAPEDRVTVQYVREYLKLLLQLGNSGHTIYGRFAELHASLRILAPKQDFDWLLCPGGVPLRSMLDMARQHHDQHESRVLFEWACELMDEAMMMAKTQPKRRRVKFRDGLLLAIFADRGMRLRSMTCIRIGHQLVRNGSKFRICFEPKDVKTKRPIEYDLHEALTPYMERYLTVERLELLGAATNDHLWINWKGKTLAYHGVEKRVRWQSEKQFGKAFGPHRFRHDATTSHCRANPGNAGAAAAMLGISQGVLEEHYNHATQADAASHFLARLKADRKESEALANNIFDKRRAPVGGDAPDDS